jgi:hypothetical protein
LFRCWLWLNILLRECHYIGLAIFSGHPLLLFARNSRLRTVNLVHGAVSMGVGCDRAFSLRSGSRPPSLFSSRFSSSSSFFPPRFCSGGVHKCRSTILSSNRMTKSALALPGHAG